MGSTLATTLGLIEDLRRRGDEFCVVTVVRTANATSAKAGAKAVVTQDGGLHGFIGGTCVQSAVRRAALKVLETGEPCLMRVKPEDEVAAALVDQDGIELHGSNCPSGGTVEFFLEPTRKRMRLLVLGSAPVAAALMQLGEAMGFDMMIAKLSANGDIENLDLKEGDAILVASQGQKDRNSLEAALHSKAGYVGMIGSRKKIEALLDQIGANVDDRRKKDLRGPAGLDIGAIEPEEIAVAILAEVIRWRRHKR